MEQSVLYYLPVWADALFFFIVLFGTVELGYRMGLTRRDTWKDADSGGGGVALTSLFAILGLVLAFTYASGVSRLDSRKQALLAEANALGTAFLRADIVAEPGRSELKNALYQYALTRTIKQGTKTDKETVATILNQTLEKQALLWPATQQVIAQDNPDPIEALLVAAMNDVIDAHTVRGAAILDRLPSIVIWMLLLVAAAALSVAGFNAGLQGIMSRWRMSALTLVLSGVMVLIVDFDRPQEGMIIVPQYAIDSVISDMEIDLNK